MKRNINLVQKELESENEERGSSDSELSESEDEEPRIKDVLNNLSEAVSKKGAFDSLHSMATSTDSPFWTPRGGQLLRNNRTIPVTNIAELAEYVLLPYNEDVTKPRVLNTFLDGLAEVGIDKQLIKNSESCTITLPPQQASTQRIRLKIRSIPKVEDGGQQPIALITSQCSRLYFLSSFSLKIVDPGRS